MSTLGISPGATLPLLAFDIGAESGRLMLGLFDGERLKVQEVYRFPNGPVRAGEHLYSDVLGIWREMQAGLQKAAALSPGGLASAGVDTWGVDFALLDRQDQLLGNPRHYRDLSNRGTLGIARSRAPAETIFNQTGNQPIEFNTLFQLLALQREHSASLEAAASLLMLPDLFHFWLCGEKVSEMTIASTSQCFSLPRRTWAWDLLERMQLPGSIFQPIASPGTVLGSLHPWLASQAGCNPFPIIAPACHDTASAVAAVPVQAGNFLYISSGTWSLIGVELDEPLISDRVLRASFTNEGGVGDRVRLLKISPGMWALQQCRAEYARRGQSYSYEQLTSLAASARPFGPLLAVGAPEFLAPGDLVTGIQEYCRRTSQQPPETPGEVARSILESLTLEYRLCLEALEALLGYSLPVIHIIGGGARNALLNQLTANATRQPVIAGPFEATVAGNLLVQAMGLGWLASLADIREVIRRSFDPQRFDPHPADDRWEEAYQRYIHLVSCSGAEPDG